MHFNFFNTPKPPLEFQLPHSLVGFESPEEVENDRRALVSQLREGTPAQQRLAEIISPCQQGARCGSAACRVCGRRFRNHFAGHLAELIANDDADWWAVTLVQSWFRKSAQDDKWSFCLTVGTLCPANQERP
jgi:hypothetical protein